ncbi:hypothetical protein C900_05388 [Fulvivirga imtechensis AK7]|uniref:Uncharacterized protein n=1 Tax=Fulvivirga imtechensis AK7 TaxID=1237149 RepID=L8JP81_9BACT|nr:hypothetical protein [Fulvivirga imtechensis]ELR69192.1 hypothetical protein C900_05388 [Fulvivirga imtechensis AK7]
MKVHKNDDVKISHKDRSINWYKRTKLLPSFRLIYLRIDSRYSVSVEIEWLGFGMGFELEYKRKEDTNAD